MPVPVEVGELLIRKLIQLAVRRGGETEPDEVIQIQRRQGHTAPLTGDEVAQYQHLALTKMLANQVAVADVTVIQRQLQLTLRAQLVDHIIFTGDLVHHADTGQLAEQRRQHIGLVPVCVNALRNHPHRHAAERPGRLDKPLQLAALQLSRQGAGL